MKILFLSRAYPPILGGIENQNHALSVWLADRPGWLRLQRWALGSAFGALAIWLAMTPRHPST